MKIERQFGVLLVPRPPTVVRDWLISAYEECGLDFLEWWDWETFLPFFPPRRRAQFTPQLNPTRQLGQDTVYSLAGSARVSWSTVASEGWEIAPPFEHPIAQRLSREAEVVSLSSIANRYFEATLYRHGRAVASTVVGPEAPTHGLPSLGMDWFEEHGIASAEELRAALGEPDEFCVIAGGQALGYGDLAEGAPVADFGPDELLVFVHEADEIIEAALERYEPSISQIGMPLFQESRQLVFTLWRGRQIELDAGRLNELAEALARVVAETEVTDLPAVTGETLTTHPAVSELYATDSELIEMDVFRSLRLAIEMGE